MKIRVINVERNNPEYMNHYFIENVEEIILIPLSSEKMALLYRLKNKEYEDNSYDELEVYKKLNTIAIEENKYED